MQHYPLLTVMRVCVEAGSALSVASGEPGDVFDNTLARDAVGLPAVPGTSIAGALRRAYRAEGCSSLFGYGAEEAQEARKKDEGGKEGFASRLCVGWGHACGADGRPVCGNVLQMQGRLKEGDSVSALLLRPGVTRDHVRLNGRGVVDGEGKFMRTGVAKGARFMFELLLWGKDADKREEEEREIAAFLRSGGFRLGGRTRAGWGRMKLVSLKARRFALPEDVEALGKYRRLLLSEEPGDPGTELCGGAIRQDEPFRALNLRTRDFLRFGGGDAPLPGKERVRNLASPYSEEAILWPEGGGKAEVARMIVFPASSVKGALRHRASFHYNRLCGRWAGTAEAKEDKEKKRDGMEPLFGYVKDGKAEGGEEQAQAGFVYLEDAYLPFPKEGDVKAGGRQHHNRIDRFTGGVADGALFTEDSLWNARLPLSVRLSDEALKAEKISYEKGKEDMLNENHIKALDMALDDLTHGRLAFGAAAMRGCGYFEEAA
jgi:CRISPR/Cas system CMR subunit Cmr4 (Cas7 group RAMP superfamily)